MNIPITKEALPVYRCPKDGSITDSICCPSCGDVLGISYEVNHDAI